MSFTSQVIKNAKETTKKTKIEKFSNEQIDSILDNSFEDFKYSDVYLCCRIKNILNDKWECARNKIESIVFGEANIPTINQCEAWEPDFKYDKQFSNDDLTEEEKTFLWLINGFKDSLGFGLGRLYSTTKIFLDVSNGKIKETRWNDEDDLLGYYTILSAEHPGPQVWLLMDNITAEAKRLGCDRKYVIASVYIHEMMHRFYDLRPDLGWKRSVKEIEEPMAEFATLKFIEELSKQSATFEKLLPIAIVMTEGLRKSDKHFIYALGVDLYYKAPIKLIYDFRRISMLLHRSSDVYVINVKQMNPMKSVEDYVDKIKSVQDLRQLVGPIKECIETYAKIFPLNKGIQ